jgi:hypothetical protein
MSQPSARTNEQTGLSPLLVGLLFVGTRLVVFFLPPAFSDVGIYARYAREQELAAHQRVPFSEFHAREVERQSKAPPSGGNSASTDEYRDVEYPPLAVAFMRLPVLAVGPPVEGELDDSFVVRYYIAFRLGMVVVDAGLLTLFVVLLGRFFPNSSRSEKWKRLLIFQACLLALWHLIYDRLDLVLAVLTLVSLALLTARRCFVWSFAALAVAVGFKLTPVVLAPLEVAGSMPAGRSLSFGKLHVLTRLAGRSALLVALIGAGFLPFLLLDGPRCLGFFSYHRARPLEIGSLPASLPLALHVFGQPISVDYSYGSINLHSSLTPALVALSGWWTAGILAATSLLMLVHFRRSALVSSRASASVASFRSATAHHARRAGPGLEGATLAQVYPLLVIRYALLFFLLFIAANKVFSPQYLLWPAPLAALLPADRRGRAFAWGFLLLCVLSTILVPFLFSSDLIDSPPTSPPTLHLPTFRLTALLVIRNLLLLGLTAALAIDLFREARGAGQGDCRL